MRHAAAALFFTTAACSAGFDPPSAAPGSSSAVCPGPDDFEINDEPESATVLSLENEVVFAASTARGDRDFYSFVVLRSDPIAIGVLHRPTDEPLIEAALSIAGVEIATARGATVLRLDRSITRGAVAMLRVRGEDSACTPYEVEIDPFFCSDPAEDDDSITAAQQFFSEISGTVIEQDDDFVALSSVASRCELELFVSAEPRGVLAWIDGAGAVIGEAPLMQEGSIWSASLAVVSGARFVRISARTTECAPYVLRCF